ncbi:MAG: 4-(cytidine 5'-diphospho)-2-C-methyl-D-erythritol kinase [Candidatus Bipolaricaulota bacterium]|nr:4-(cytidine 5'-diphospho)-2-C-methyl-D-erythritol kinase [Candidatus Bipolaricaulota bacterium]
MKILAKTFAKVNPRINVLGKLDDGYHELDISFLSVNLADRMTFEPSNQDRITLSTGADIPPEENLCYRVAKKLKESCSHNKGAEVTLEKRIPIGGGLGGGSSNAATTLICLNRLWDCNLSRRELIRLGKEFGADVPFFFYGGYCTGTGKGSELRKKENLFRDCFIPLIIPPFPQLTSEVYSRFDELTEYFEKGRSGKDRNYPLELGNFTVENDLQRAVIDLNPKLENYLNLLKNASTIQTAGVAGSGSSLFGISRMDVSSGEIKEEIEEDLWSISDEAKLIVVRPTNHGQIVKEEE